MKKFNFAILSAFMLSVAVAHGGTPPTQISSSQVITVPGHYILANDIASASGGFGIEIQASDVHLDLDGHTINAPQGSGVGITFFPGTATSPSNVRVTNGAIVAASYGITIYGSYCIVRGLTITAGESGNVFQNCTLEGVFVDSILEDDQAGSNATVLFRATG
jgi:hypothetical protein